MGLHPATQVPPSFTYLGEANPEFYVNPVAVPSLKFVGAALPWAEDGSTALQQPGEEGGSLERKGNEVKARAKGKKNAKAKAKNDEGNRKGKSKAKPAQATKKTSITAVPKPPVQSSGGRLTRSMSKASVNSGAAGSISTGPKTNACEPDALDARPAKRARVSESQEGTASNQVSEKLVTGLPPLSVVRKRSSAAIGDENEVSTPVADEKSTIVSPGEEIEATAAPLETTTKDNVDGIAQQPQAINNATEESLKASCTDVEVQETGEAEIVTA
ncbi:hypothetical protein EYR36_009990 [Pleurotus pulmonarius]|nr:hypothetical protein EYR36_009990 [Pleurotus pulmonarius]KAF4593466.1 hypothetical protein EYR38_009181 [Pleurotus pulmonarius]